jgi:hypothetical protein
MNTNGDKILRQICKRLRDNDAQTRAEYGLYMELN